MAKKRRMTGMASPSSSKMRYEARGDDVMMARDRLKGALQELINSDEDSSSSQEEIISTPSKPVQIKKEIKPTIIRRRKRKAAVDLEMGFHHTFVMKLFDRSVDLAQFKDDTPLYPICRAWIANQPRVPLPYPPLESPEIKNEVEGAFEFDTEVVREMEKLPPPISPPLGCRIPAVAPPQLTGISLDYSGDNLPTAEELLKGHVSRWTNIRKQWLDAAQINESRFQNSGKVLSNMYKRAQSAFLG
ncbi:protein lin-37 homolog [Homalodisca vitripennis]|uniref:protein lin-37 homolog n=1 Tax=Homalodisca vitripennis TaxID=197043 RepID=UPI001EEAEC7A|nr:protein lin-37 homolog [Homalodisca vitripennis]